MKNQKILLKIAVLTGFALVLVSFVSYRAGALDRIFSSDAKYAIAAVDSPPPTPELMSGSKSAVIVRPDSEDKIMFSGSKSGEMLWVEPPAETTATVRLDTNRDRTMMNSTKAGYIIHPADTVFQINQSTQQTPVNQSPPPQKINQSIHNSNRDQR